MLDYLKRLFGFSKPAQTVEAPYKLEASATVEFVPAEPKKCGCGRSETGNCVGLHAVSDAEWATHEKNPNKAKKAPKAKTAKAPAKAKPAAKAKAPAKAKTKAKKA